MFARSVTVRLKPNSVTEFNRTLEKEVRAAASRASLWRGTNKART